MGFWAIAVLVILLGLFAGAGATLTLWLMARKSDKQRDLNEPAERGKEFARYRHGVQWREDRKVACIGAEGCRPGLGGGFWHSLDCPIRRDPLMSYRQLTAERLEEATKGYNRDQLASFQRAFEEQYAVLVDRSKVVANIQHSVSRMERELKHTEEAYKELE